MLVISTPGECILVVVVSKMKEVLFPKVIFHPPENHHPHHNLSFGLSVLWKFKDFSSHKTLFGYTQILF